LTNASSLLALSTSNRFLRAGERLRIVAAELEHCQTAAEREWRIRHIDRIEHQAALLLGAMRADYVALGSFVTASLVCLVGAALASRQMHPLDEIMMVLGMIAGFSGAAALVFASVRLLQATKLSMVNISEEAEMIRLHRTSPSAPSPRHEAGDTTEIGI